MKALNSALVTSLRTVLPTNAANMQLYRGEFAVFAQQPVPDVVADFHGSGPAMYMVLGPTVRDENPMDKDGLQREVVTTVTVWVSKHYESASSVDGKAREIIDELQRNPELLSIAGWLITLLEVQGVFDNDIDHWYGRVVGVRVLLERDPVAQAMMGSFS